MIAMLVRKLTLTMLLAMLGMALLEQFNPAPPPMVIDFHRADYPVCVTIPTGPVIPPKPTLSGSPPVSEID